MTEEEFKHIVVEILRRKRGNFDLAVLDRKARWRRQLWSLAGSIAHNARMVAPGWCYDMGSTYKAICDHAVSAARHGMYPQNTSWKTVVVSGKVTTFSFRRKRKEVYGRSASLRLLSPRKGARKMSSKRPTYINSEEVREAVLSEAVKILMGWDNNLDEEEARDAMESAIDAGLNLDGYHLARELEHEWIDPDESLVESLSRLKVVSRKAEVDAVRKWVTENGIKPSKAVGDQVIRNGMSGEIIRVDEKDAVYVVHFPDLGHKKSNGVLGLLIPFEEAGG